MDYLKQYKSFISSHYLSEGIRMTAGILIPAFTLSYFNHLGLGILMSLGALCVSLTDSPGPIHHRRNAMMTCSFAVLLMAAITDVVNSSNIATSLLIVVATLFFSMLGVFGPRPGSIGIAALVVMVLGINVQVQIEVPILERALLMAGGGVWYMLFSLALYKFRPYKLAQQALGEYVQTIAAYFRSRAILYKKGVLYDDAYKKLLVNQAIVQEKQGLVRELLLKSQVVVKEATPTGKLLLVIFTDISDLFERIITSYQRYSLLHQYFDDTTILGHINEIIVMAANKMDDIGIAIKTGSPSTDNSLLAERVKQLCVEFKEIETTHLDSTNLDLFLGLRRTVSNLQDITKRLQTIQDYLQKGIADKVPGRLRSQEYLDQFIHHQPVTWQELMNNLTLQSDAFRHALRITIAMLTGFVVAISFNLGHGYWILLTILVIMKPAYSLTKKRNADRIIGTVAGVVIGMLLLFFIKDATALLIIMVVFMAASYTFMRTNYLLSVLLMTPYLLLFFNLMQPDNFQRLLADRVIDTLIGSAIAFAASIWLFPSWEKNKVMPLLINTARQVKQYFSITTANIIGESTTVAPRLARKDAFVALANLSDTFNRMLSEPKNQQKNTEELQRLIVLFHVLVSYVATLAYHIKEKPAAQLAALKNASLEIQGLLDSIIIQLEQNQPLNESVGTSSLQQLHAYADNLLEERHQQILAGIEEDKNDLSIELKQLSQQFNLITKTASDIHKLTARFKLSA